MIRVLIADDQELVRSGLRLILEAQPDIEVVGEAEDGMQAVSKAARLHPDVVLMDIRMPKVDGLQATRKLAQAPDGPRVVILTTFDADDHVYEAMRSGASGFLLKDIRPEQLADAVRTVSAGDAMLAPAITRRLIERFVERPRGGWDLPSEFERLTDREAEVLEMMARGRSNHEIADALGIGEATVKTHVNRIFAKLEVRDRVQAVVRAYESGFIDVPDRGG
ncbi:MAG: response regulator transcription factor [Actinobacteria bacterium]|nr:response regulator transcription factor [Actinomycetota bacterium]